MIRDRAELFAYVSKDRALSHLWTKLSQDESTDPAHDLEHTIRVALWALRLGTDTVCQSSVRES